MRDGISLDILKKKQENNIERKLGLIFLTCTQEKQNIFQLENYIVHLLQIGEVFSSTELYRKRSIRFYCRLTGHARVFNRKIGLYSLEFKQGVNEKKFMHYIKA